MGDSALFPFHIQVALPCIPHTPYPILFEVLLALVSLGLFCLWYHCCILAAIRSTGCWTLLASFSPGKRNWKPKIGWFVAVSPARKGDVFYVPCYVSGGVIKFELTTWYTHTHPPNWTSANVNLAKRSPSDFCWLGVFQDYYVKWSAYRF